MIFGINTTSDISKLLYIISRAVRRVKFETILKYHEWYLSKISRTNHAITYTKSFEHHHHHYHQKCIELSTSTAQTMYNNVEFGVMNAGFMAIYG